MQKYYTIHHGNMKTKQIKLSVKSSNNKQPVVRSKYWYSTDIYSCVLCGKQNIYKSRVHEESKKGTRCFDDMCWTHKF